MEVSPKTRSPSPILPSNSRKRKAESSSPSTGPDHPIGGDTPPTTDGHIPSGHEDVQMDESSDREEDEEEEEEENDIDTKYSEVPLILPRRSFKGISNLRTIKDGTVFVGR